MLERSQSLLGLAIVLFLLLHLIVLYGEEPGLENRFGDSYRRYKSSANRRLPFFRRE